MNEELLAVACMPGLSHGSFRLYVVLAGVAHQRGARDSWFPVTLAGLQKVHPGTSEKTAGFTTLVKQIAELRRHSLVDMRASLVRSEPRLPVLVKVLYPKPDVSWRATDGSQLTVPDVVRAVESQ